MIIYGAFGNVSIGALFLGGLGPGLLIGFLMMGYTYIMAVKHNYPANSSRAPLSEMAKAVGGGFFPLLIPIIILGGIIGGFFTPTEAAIIAVVWALFLSIGLYRQVSWKDLLGILSLSVVDFAVVMFAVAAAKIFGFLISYLGAAELVVNLILGITHNPIGIMLLLVCFLLIIGTVLNPIAVVTVFLPIIQGLGDTAGMNPVHLGVLTVIVLAIGLVTPPYGICLLIAGQIAETSVARSFWAVLPILGLTLLVALVSIFIPDIVIGLPKLIMPNLF
jgi:tripartite ATP-independent transporter DctM subunit